MIDPEKEDWKYPHTTRLKNYAIGGGYALLFVAVILTMLYFTLTPPNPRVLNHFEDALEKPAIAVQEALVVPVAKPAIKKAATKSINKPTIPDAIIPVTDLNPVKPAEPLTQFDRDLANFESKIP